jgi:hypothetical protein
MAHHPRKAGGRPTHPDLVNNKNWTPELNYQWLDSAMERGYEIWLVPDPSEYILKNPNSFFFKELDYLAEKSYDNIVSMFLK